MTDETETEAGMVVARIRIERRMMPNGGDVVLAEFDDGRENGETPAAVELLGMLAMTTDSVLHGGIYDDEDES